MLALSSGWSARVRARCQTMRSLYVGRGPFAAAALLDQSSATVAQRRSVGLGEDRQLGHVPQTGAHPLANDLANAADRNDLLGGQPGRLGRWPGDAAGVAALASAAARTSLSTTRPRGPVPVTVAEVHLKLSVPGGGQPARP